MSTPQTKIVTTSRQLCDHAIDGASYRIVAHGHMEQDADGAVLNRDERTLTATYCRDGDSGEISALSFVSQVAAFPDLLDALLAAQAAAEVVADEHPWPVKLGDGWHRPQVVTGSHHELPTGARYCDRCTADVGLIAWPCGPVQLHLDLLRNPEVPGERRSGFDRRLRDLDIPALVREAAGDRALELAGSVRRCTTAGQESVAQGDAKGARMQLDIAQAIVRVLNILEPESTRTRVAEGQVAALVEAVDRLEAAMAGDVSETSEPLGVGDASLGDDVITASGTFETTVEIDGKPISGPVDRWAWSRATKPHPFDALLYPPPPGVHAVSILPPHRLRDRVRRALRIG